jgi:hypothetical protein
LKVIRPWELRPAMIFPRLYVELGDSNINMEENGTEDALERQTAKDDGLSHRSLFLVAVAGGSFADDVVQYFGSASGL